MLPHRRELVMLPEVAEAVGPYYVYLLRDPRDGTVFYVGKGTGQRIYSHHNHAVTRTPDPDLDAAKTQRLHAILTAGQAPEHLFVRTGLPDENTAYTVEQAVIDAYHAAGLTLLNLQRGHHAATHGLSTPQEQQALHAAAPAPPLPPGSVVFLINRAWKSGDSPNAIYVHTHGHWKIGARSRANAVHAFGVARGVIRGAYNIRDWYPDPERNGRWGFNGNPDPTLNAYLGKHVRHILNDAGPGSQNPVRLFL